MLDVLSSNEVEKGVGKRKNPRAYVNHTYVSGYTHTKGKKHTHVQKQSVVWNDFNLLPCSFCRILQFNYMKPLTMLLTDCN